MKVKIISLLVIAVIFVSGCTIPKIDPTPIPGAPNKDVADLKKMSLEDAQTFIKKNTVSYGGRGFAENSIAKSTISAPMAAIQQDVGGATVAGGSTDFSKTNVQVEGVDEADIVKTDGKYIYTVSDSKKIVIVEVYPAENGKVLSTIEVNGSVQEIFINDDKLVVFGTKYEDVDQSTESGEISKSSLSIMPRRPYMYGRQFVRVYDVSDKSNPILKKDTKLNGNYFNSRMIGNWVYFVVNNNAYNDIVLPLEAKCVGVKGGCNQDVYYFDVPANSYMLTLVGGINLENLDAEPSTKTFLLPYTEEMFASMDNIYITHQKIYTEKDGMEDMLTIVRQIMSADVASRVDSLVNSPNYNGSWEQTTEIQQILSNYTDGLGEQERWDLQDKLYSELSKLQSKREKTVVYKISIKDGEISMVAKGEFNGKILNQFSMDEFGGYFRVAATTGNVWDKTSENHVYVLDGELKVVGKLEGLAPGESIYSARFIGERAYLVTFKKVDPLFVIDLKDPLNPKILGKLKIPGFSDYLHPYDQNHIIGIGKNTVEASEELKTGRDLDFAWYQGVKLALFDVTDPENPKEVSKYVIGDRGTDSYALQDHKAFLFNKDKNLLVIPVLLAEISEAQKKDASGSEYGDYTFQGAYVFELTKEKGFILNGRITHVTDQESFKKSGYYYFGSGDLVKRSLYIGNVLYTVSDSTIKGNSLDNLEEIKSIPLPYNKEPIEPPYLDGPMF